MVGTSGNDPIVASSLLEDAGFTDRWAWKERLGKCADTAIFAQVRCGEITFPLDGLLSYSSNGGKTTWAFRAYAPCTALLLWPSAS